MEAARGQACYVPRASRNTLKDIVEAHLEEHRQVRMGYPAPVAHRCTWHAWRVSIPGKRDPNAFTVHPGSLADSTPQAVGPIEHLRANPLPVKTNANVQLCNRLARGRKETDKL